MRSTASWADLERAAPAFTEAGRRLMVGGDGIAIAFLATCSTAGVPHLGPVCPVFCDDHVYLVAGARTVKVRDLRANDRFVLHAFLGENDEELQVAGRAVEVDDPRERERVHAAVPYPAFDREDPIFRFGLERALHVYWERVGQPDTRPVRRRWTARGR